MTQPKCALTKIQFDSAKSDDELFNMKKRAYHESDLAVIRINDKRITIDERRTISGICNRLYGYKANLLKG